MSRFCFSCHTPGHFAGDRTHPCIPPKPRPQTVPEHCHCWNIARDGHQKDCRRAR